MATLHPYYVNDRREQNPDWDVTITYRDTVKPARDGARYIAPGDRPVFIPTKRATVQ